MSLNALRKSSILGMLAVAAYVLHVVLGGILWKGYDHLMQPISDLTASGAPNRELLGLILWFYGIPAILFGLFACLYMRRLASRSAQAGMMMYFLMQLVSLLYQFFPQDLPGAVPTLLGTLHIVITFLIIPLTILAPVLVGTGLRKLAGFERFGIYSIVAGILIFIFGGTTAFFFAQKLAYFGLVERLNIGTLQIWTLLLALKIYSTDASTMSRIGEQALA